MPSITEQVQTLVEQGGTEEALETLANWLRTEQSFALNEVILLRSRYEKVQQELGLDLISPEDAARAYNQISFSLLNLVQSVERTTDAPTPRFASPTESQHPKRQAQLLMVGGLIIFAILLFFVINRFTSSDNKVSNNAAKASMLQLPQGKEASLQTLETKVTFTVLEAKTESYNSENQKITMKIRCFLGAGRGGMNFWADSFRLIIDDLPYAAQGGLNEVVKNESFKDGKVYFLIPKAARAADLKMTFYGEYTVLPVQW